MAIDEDEEDFVFYGTPIEREEDTSARKRKAVADAGQLRSLPQWKQEVSSDFIETLSLSTYMSIFLVLYHQLVKFCFFLGI